MRDGAAQGTASLRMAGTVDFAYWTNIPLTMDANMSQVVAFEARFMVVGVVMGERGIDQYAMNSSSSINFVTKFDSLDC